jgi:hypothetical protein
MMAVDTAHAFRDETLPTLAWLKVKVPNYRERECRWQAKPSDRG